MDIQKASMLKRISAFMFDAIILGILAVAFGMLFSWAFGYNGHSDTLNAAYEKYESEYGIEFEITAEEYAAMSEAELSNYNAAYDALVADESAMYAYNMVINLTMLITTLGILAAFIALEFVVPLILKNGQTLGKKIFGICLIKPDCVKINNLQLFARTVLGKFTIETMIPVYIIIMLYFNTVGLEGTLLLLALLIAQIVLLFATANRSLIHDLLAGTVAVDMASQMIFSTTEDMLEYKKKKHEEAVRNSVY